MLQFGGKPKKTSSDSKRHFTVVMGTKEHGLYVSSTPSSAARKAVTKLCTLNKNKKVEFCIREITQGSKKKTYGPYLGHIEKLKDPIELKGRLIKYKPVAKLSKKNSVMKGGLGEKNYERKDIDKMFENFLVVDQGNHPAQIHLKERMMKPDNLYFGIEHLIEYNTKKYYPYCLINITGKEEYEKPSGDLIINDLYLRILEKNDDQSSLIYLAKTRKLNYQINFIEQEIPNIGYSLLTFKVYDILTYLYLFFNQTYYKRVNSRNTNRLKMTYEEFIIDLQNSVFYEPFTFINVEFKNDNDLMNISNNYFMNNNDVKNLYLFYNIIQSINNSNLAGIKSKKIMVFREKMTKFLPNLKSLFDSINDMIENAYNELIEKRNKLYGK